MKIRMLLSTAVVVVFAVLAAGGTGVATTTDVGTDPAGDWGTERELAPLGEALGQDLVGAAITTDETTARFVIKVSKLPDLGGMPEVTRYTWNFLANGKKFELDGKWSNYSRGTCDPSSGKCPPPRDPGMQPFFLRGNCTQTGTVTTCQELALLRATFDPAQGTVTVPVPLTLLATEGKECIDIAPGQNLFAGSVSATPSAYFTSSAMPMDTMELDDRVVTAC